MLIAETSIPELQTNSTKVAVAVMPRRDCTKSGWTRADSPQFAGVVMCQICSTWSGEKCSVVAALCQRCQP